MVSIAWTSVWATFGQRVPPLRRRLNQLLISCHIGCGLHEGIRCSQVGASKTSSSRSWPCSSQSSIRVSYISNPGYRKVERRVLYDRTSCPICRPRSQSPLVGDDPSVAKTRRRCPWSLEAWTVGGLGNRLAAPVESPLAFQGDRGRLSAPDAERGAKRGPRPSLNQRPPSRNTHSRANTGT